MTSHKNICIVDLYSWQHPMLSVCYHSKSLGLHADSSEDETFHAIIVANSNYEGALLTQSSASRTEKNYEWHC